LKIRALRRLVLLDFVTLRLLDFVPSASSTSHSSDDDGIESPA